MDNVDRVQQRAAADVMSALRKHFPNGAGAIKSDVERERLHALVLADCWSAGYRFAVEEQQNRDLMTNILNGSVPS